MGLGSVDTIDNTTTASATRTAAAAAAAAASSSDEECNFTGQHPELETFCLIDCDTRKRVVPNYKPIKIPIDNECFEGYYYMMVRTPDVDNKKDKNKGSMGESAKRISSYMKGKKRRFEFQFQIKLKKIPTGPWFLGCEVEHPIIINRFVKGLTGVLMAMVRRINPGFHYSWGIDVKNPEPDVDVANGVYEKTHLSFPLDASMDRIVISKPGEEPPQLGHELFESNQSVKRRRKTGFGSVDWNTSDTYTMCLWSAYMDWITWKSINVPGVRPFSLSSVTGHQPVYLCVYELHNISPDNYKKIKPPHNRCDVTTYSRVEFSNIHKTQGGICDDIDAFKRKTKTEEEIEEELTEDDTDDASQIFTDSSRHENVDDLLKANELQNSVHALKDCEEALKELKTGH